MRNLSIRAHSARWALHAGGFSIALCVLIGCGGPQDHKTEVAPAEEVVVQHVLIAFRGVDGFGRALPPRARHRNAAEAEALGHRLAKMVDNREPMGKLVQQFTDDPFALSDPAEADAACQDGCGRVQEWPGAYLVKTGQSPTPLTADAPPSARLVRILHRSLLEAGHQLAHGETRLFAHDPERYPLGHHLVRRLR